MIPLRDTIRSESTPYVNYALIAANVLAFLYQLMVQASFEQQALAEVVAFARAHGVRAVPAEVVAQRAEQLYTEWMKRWGLVPGEVVNVGGLYEYVSFFTSMFLHANWLHLGGNMLYLYVFGDNVEDRVGHGGYLLYYVGCGLAAAGAQFIINPESQIPMVGASGAIAGALGGYLVLFPHARVLTLVPIFFFLHFMEIPATIFLVIWFLFQNLAPAALAPASQGGVAYWAHIGGFAAGAAYCWLNRETLRQKPVVRYERPEYVRRWDTWDRRRPGPWGQGGGFGGGG